jgi:hypothetical protein
VAGSCVYGDEPSGSIKCRNFLSGLRRFNFSGRTLLHGVFSFIFYLEKIRFVLEEEKELWI